MKTHTQIQTQIQTHDDNCGMYDKDEDNSDNGGEDDVNCNGDQGDEDDANGDGADLDDDDEDDDQRGGDVAACIKWSGPT